MKSLRALLLLAGIFSATLWAQEPAEDKPTWLKDWPAAQRLAQKLNRPVFAVFVCQH